VCLASIIAWLAVLIFGEPNRFDRLVSRLVLGILFISIFPLKNYLRFNWQTMGFSPSQRNNVNQFIVGLLLGLGMMAFIIGSLFVLEIRIYDEPNKSLASILLKAGITGCLVGVLEEILFRGLLVSFLLRNTTTVSAALVSSSYYAGLHFLKTELLIPANAISWSSGIELFINALGRLFQWSNFDSFLALCLTGLFLCAIRLGFKYTLACCIGLHCAWVFSIKLTRALSDLNANSSLSFLVGDYDGIIGYLVAGCLLIFLLIFLYWQRNHSSSANNDD